MPVYKQHPMWSALIGAVACLVMGSLSFLVVNQRVQSGDMGKEKLLLPILVTVIVSGILIIVAFSRYQFTHLWMGLRKRPHRYHHKKKPLS